MCAVAALDGEVRQSQWMRPRELPPLSARQTTLRLGSAEEMILSELRRSGGPVPRRLLVSVVMETSMLSRRHLVPTGAGEARAIQNAESTLSRALRSLERKSLIVRSYSHSTKHTLVSLPNPPAPPAWEREARAEETFAARCDAVIAELTELGRRARRRAARLRMERSSASTMAENASDAAHWKRVMSTPSL